MQAKKGKFMLRGGGCIPLISMEKSSSDGAEQMLMIEPERHNDKSARVSNN